MSDPFGFLKYQRIDNIQRDIKDRILDFKEIKIPLPFEERRKQALRCMNCGIPFCHSANDYSTKFFSGCPNDNLIPEWNALIGEGKLKEAFLRLIKTNPLPEMTGRACPAPCEKSCTESLHGSGVSICDNELFLIEQAFENGWVYDAQKPGKFKHNTKIAIIGSGPCGLSAAIELNRLGFIVTVFEKQDISGGLLMYGIPNMKLDKNIIKRRIDLMQSLGIRFINNCEIGKDVSVSDLLRDFDRILLATGAEVARDLHVEGRDANGIFLAVDFLTNVTKSLQNNKESELKATFKDKTVVVVGGGDTGSDCIASSIRMGAKQIISLEIASELHTKRSSTNVWPQYPIVKNISYGEKEASYKYTAFQTMYNESILTFTKDAKGNLTSITTAKVNEKFEFIEGTKKQIKADIVLLAMGFVSRKQELFDELKIANINDDFSTNNSKIFVAGDAKRGASLIIWAIKEGREAAIKIANTI